MDTRMYVMTHKKIENLPEKIYQPLHVGREGKKDLGYPGDDTGEQISCKNPHYCELTGMYWLWKNVKCDIIGICHYRRFFLRNGKLLKQEEIEELVQNYPIIIPNSRCVREKNVYEHYGNRHNAKDLDLCREVIAEKYPAYISAYDYAMDTILISMANMWITRKEIFDRYCQWLFDILFEVERRLDMTGYDEYQQRVMGFLSERLFRVWLFMQPEKIAEENIEMAESEDFWKPQKRKSLMLQVLRLKLAPVISLHKNHAGTLIEDIGCQDDFGGKSPVWFCYLPGENEMPETVKFCYTNLKKIIFKSTQTFRFITLENCMEYVSFSPSVIQKFNDGRLDMKELTELFRAEVLYRYGGTWVDANLFLTSGGLESLPVIPKELPIFRFVVESLWYYYEIEDKGADEGMCEDIFALAAQEFPEYRLKDETGLFKKGEGDLYFERRYFPERFAKLQEEKGCQEMELQKVYARRNSLGFLTMYGYLAQQMQI